MQHRAQQPQQLDSLSAGCKDQDSWQQLPAGNDTAQQPQQHEQQQRQSLSSRVARWSKGLSKQRSEEASLPRASTPGLYKSGSTASMGSFSLSAPEPSSSPLLTFWSKVWVLMVRFALSWVRTPIMAVAEAGQYVILSLFLGLLYLRSPLALPNAPLDRMGAMFVVLTMLSLTPSYTVLVMWDHERLLLRRETSTNMYSR